MERRLIFLLVGFIISCHIAIRAADCAENRLIADFESTNQMGDGWDLTAEVVEAAMDVINSLNAFKAISGAGPASIKGAKTVQTVTSNFDIVVN